MASVAGAVKPLLDAEKALTSGRQEVEDRVEAERRQEREALAAARGERDAAERSSPRSSRDGSCTTTSPIARPRRTTASGWACSRPCGATSATSAAGCATRSARGPTWSASSSTSTTSTAARRRRSSRCSRPSTCSSRSSSSWSSSASTRAGCCGSLQHHYRGPVRAPRRRPGRLPGHRRRSDYLEKIFQIPFTLRPMDRRRLPAAGRRAAAPVGADGPGDGGGRRRRPRTFAPGPLAAPEPALATPASSRSRPKSPTRPGRASGPTSSAFLAELAELVPTPRAAKRLANTYRLLRAPLEQAALEALVAGEHRAVLTLLAALVGAPGAANQAFGALLAEPPETPWSEFLTRLEAAPVRTETRQLAAALRAVTERTGLAGELRTFQSWTPRVARYSFETSRIAPESMPRTASARARARPAARRGRPRPSRSRAPPPARGPAA